MDQSKYPKSIGLEDLMLKAKPVKLLRHWGVGVHLEEVFTSLQGFTEILERFCDHEVITMV